MAGMCSTDEVEAINKTDVAASQGLELHGSKDDETTPLAGTLPATPLPDHQAAQSSPQIQSRSEMSTRQFIQGYGMTCYFVCLYPRFVENKSAITHAKSAYMTAYRAI
jgi:hypothetical protein